jgi:hypothetical protein
VLAVPHAAQRRGQLLQALGNPQQRAFRAAQRHRPDQCQQVALQRGVDVRQPLAPTTGTAQPTARDVALVEFLQPTPDGAGGDPRGPRHRGEAAIAKRPHLAGGEQASATLVKARAQQIIMAADGDFVDHAVESSGSHFARESST